MKRFIPLLAALLLVLPGPAQAANGPQITKAEYNRIHDGMSRAQAFRIIGSHGVKAASGPVGVFVSCPPYATDVAECDVRSGPYEGRRFKGTASCRKAYIEFVRGVNGYEVASKDGYFGTC